MTTVFFGTIYKPIISTTDSILLGEYIFLGEKKCILLYNCPLQKKIPTYLFSSDYNAIIIMFILKNVSRILLDGLCSSFNNIN